MADEIKEVRYVSEENLDFFLRVCIVEFDKRYLNASNIHQHSKYIVNQLGDALKLAISENDTLIELKKDMDEHINPVQATDPETGEPLFEKIPLVDSNGTPQYDAEGNPIMINGCPIYENYSHQACQIEENDYKQFVTAADKKKWNDLSKGIDGLAYKTLHLFPDDFNEEEDPNTYLYHTKELWVHNLHSKNLFISAYNADGESVTLGYKVHDDDSITIISEAREELWVNIADSRVTFIKVDEDGNPVNGQTFSYTKVIEKSKWLRDENGRWYHDVLHNLNSENLLPSAMEVLSKYNVLIASKAIDYNTTRVFIDEPETISLNVLKLDNTEVLENRMKQAAYTASIDPYDPATSSPNNWLYDEANDRYYKRLMHNLSSDVMVTARDYNGLDLLIQSRTTTMNGRNAVEVYCNTNTRCRVFIVSSKTAGITGGGGGGSAISDATDVLLVDEENRYESENVEGALWEISVKQGDQDLEILDLKTSALMGSDSELSDFNITGDTIIGDVDNLKETVNDIVQTIEEHKKTQYFINVKEFGADPTGTIDSTEAIRSALEYCKVNKIGALFFENGGSYKVSLINAEKEIVFDIPLGNFIIDLNGANIFLDPMQQASVSEYVIFNINRKMNVVIRNGIITGDRATHNYNTPGNHDNGIGVYIENSTVELERCVLKEMVGTGIYAMDYATDGTAYERGNSSVLLESVYIYNCRASAITVNCFNNFTMNDCKIMNIGAVGTGNGSTSIGGEISAINLDPTRGTRTIYEFTMRDTDITCNDVALKINDYLEKINITNCTINGKISNVSEVMIQGTISESNIIYAINDESASIPSIGVINMANNVLRVNRLNVKADIDNCEFIGDSGAIIDDMIYLKAGIIARNCKFSNIKNERTQKGLIFNCIPNTTSYTTEIPDSKNKFYLTGTFIDRCDVDFNAAIDIVTTFNPIITGANLRSCHFNMPRGNIIFSNCNILNPLANGVQSNYRESIIMLHNCDYTSNEESTKDTVFNNAIKCITNSRLTLDSFGENFFKLEGQPSAIANSVIYLNKDLIPENVGNGKIINCYIRILTTQPDTPHDYQGKLINTSIDYNIM